MPPSSPLRKISPEDEVHLASLRYNVNVFLPHTKSLEQLSPPAYQQHLQDQEHVRNAALTLWNDILPNLTKELRDTSGHQIPVDGVALTELLHSRGINCRYLGRLAQLAQIEEGKDREAEKKGENLPRRIMPFCWLEILECEIVARAAKHVLDSYLTEEGGVAASRPNQTIASFLSALMSVGEESAAETETRIAKIKGKLPDEDELKGMTVFDAGEDGDAVVKGVRGRAEVWEDVEREVGKRFRYVLTLYNRGSTVSKEDAQRALYLPLFRRVCQRTGVRLVARKYDLGGKCLCGTGATIGGRIIPSHPISPVDVIDLFPIVKHAASQAAEGFVPCTFTSSFGSPSLHILLPDAKATFEAAHVHWTARSLPKALDLAQEAATLYQRVVDTPLHVSVARCLDLTAVILFQAQEPELAAANAARALAVSVQLNGFDCAEAVAAHTTLAHILISSGGLAGGVKHLRAALYLMELMAGPHYSDLASVCHKIGTMYHEVGNEVTALKFYQEACQKKTCDRMVESMIAKSTALVLASLGQFKAALESEKRAYGIYRSIWGEQHDLTLNSASSLKQFMKLAVEQGTRMVAEEKKRREEEAAHAIATKIEAEEDEEEEKKKKKKKKKAKKKT